MVKYFPTLSRFSNFIFIDGSNSALEVTKENEKEMNIITERLKKGNYLIVIDDAHLVLN